VGLRDLPGDVSKERLEWTPMTSKNAQYPSVGAPRWVAEVSADQTKLWLDDDSEWTIDPADRAKASKLLATKDAVVRSAPAGFGDYVLMGAEFVIRMKFDRFVEPG
jgi:hypothetical protein